MQNRMKRIKLTIHTIILLVLVSFICVAQSNEEKCSLSETPDLLKDEKGKPITITSSEMGKRFISGEKPNYPGGCRCQGAVYFLLHIDAKGEVRCSQFISGHPLLRAAVAKVIKGWRFTLIKQKMAINLSQLSCLIVLASKHPRGAC